MVLVILQVVDLVHLGLLTLEIYVIDLVFGEEGITNTDLPIKENYVTWWRMMKKWTIVKGWIELNCFHLLITLLQKERFLRERRQFGFCSNLY